MCPIHLKNVAVVSRMCRMLDSFLREFLPDSEFAIRHGILDSQLFSGLIFCDTPRGCVRHFNRLDLTFSRLTEDFDR